jgi:hypothetical protein
VTIHIPEPASPLLWDDGNYVLRNEVQEARENEREARIGPGTRGIADRRSGISDATSPRPGYGQFVVFIADPRGSTRLDWDRPAETRVQQICKCNKYCGTTSDLSTLGLS